MSRGGLNDIYSNWWIGRCWSRSFAGRGAITDICRDSYAGSPLRRIKCQLWTNLPSSRGDSGGPAFFRLGNPSNDSEVELIGVLSRGDETSTTIISTMVQIQAELGPVTVTGP
jgi:hypothetical protein